MKIVVYGATRRVGSRIVADAFNRGHALVASVSSGFMAGEPDFGIYIGGAGSLFVARGLRAVDTLDFPDAVKPGALAHADGLDHAAALVDELERPTAFRQRITVAK